MDEIQKIFCVSVKFSKQTPGKLLDDLNYSELKRKVKEGISEAVGASQGVISCRQISEIEEGYSDES